MNIEKKANFIKRMPWGNELYYPDCEFSTLICKLLMQKSVTRVEIRTLKDFGWDVEIEEQDIDRNQK